MNYGFFLFRFVSTTDRDAFLSNGPWVVDDATLGLEPWSSAFLSSPGRLPRIVLWFRLPHLPSDCWNASVLKLIVSPARRFIKMDDSTSMMMNGRFARVAVKIDTACPLSPELMWF